VILDTRTFDVLALADAPTFDANSPGASPMANLESRALMDTFEPGSTNKVITAAAALQEGKAKPSTRLTVPGVLQRGGATFHDAENHSVEKLTLAGVLAKSSNIGAIKIGERLSPSTMYGYQTKFGLGSRTGVGLAESTGILAPYQDWNNSQRYTVLFGQGLSVTSLQMADVFATIANDGVRRTPRLIKAVTGLDGGALQQQPLGATTRVISARTARQLRLMLEGVVSDAGTGVLATVPGYRVAGKTGTAQAYDAKCGCYNGYTASFIGIAPADKPRLVVAVFLQNPVGDHFGGSVAAPVFKELMTSALLREGIAPTGAKAPDVPLDWH
jgi:cell division protein FtsI (penicillin-binding protein 3)